MPGSAEIFFLSTAYVGLVLIVEFNLECLQSTAGLLVGSGHFILQCNCVFFIFFFLGVLFDSDYLSPQT